VNKIKGSEPFSILKGTVNGLESHVNKITFEYFNLALLGPRLANPSAVGILPDAPGRVVFKPQGVLLDFLCFANGEAALIFHLPGDLLKGFAVRLRKSRQEIADNIDFRCKTGIACYFHEEKKT